MEALDNEFRLLVQRINSLMEQSLKTHHEKNKLKLWLDKLVLENEEDETTKSNRNEYGHYLEDFICKNGTLPAMCYRGPPDGKLPPLRQLMRRTDGNDDNTSKVRKEEKLKDFTREAGCHGRPAYDEAYEEIKKYKQQLDNCMREKLRQLIMEERAAANDEIQQYRCETSRMRSYFSQCEKEILDLAPHFNWSEYREKPETYVKDTVQQCRPKQTADASDCQIRRIQEDICRAQVENQMLEDRLVKIRCEVEMENNELEKILNDSDLHLERVQGLKMRIDNVDDIMSSIVNELDECSRGEY